MKFTINEEISTMFVTIVYSFGNLYAESPGTPGRHVFTPRRGKIETSIAKNHDAKIRSANHFLLRLCTCASGNIMAK